MPGRADTDAIEAFVSNQNVGAFTHAIDEDGAIWSEFGVTSQPAFAFIDDDGTITVINGAMGFDGISAEVEKLQAS